MIALAPLVADVVAGDRLQTVSLFDPQYLFSTVPQLAAQVRPYFELLAFVILAAVGVRRWLAQAENPAIGIAPVVIAGLFIGIIPLSLNTADQAVDDLVGKSGMADPLTIAKKLYALADGFTPINKGEETNIKNLQQTQGNPDAYAQEKVKQYSFWGVDLTGAVNFFKKITDQTATGLKVAYDTVKEPLGAIGDWFKGCLFKLIAIACAAGAWFLLQVCSLIVYVFLSVRFLLIHLESIVLPVFIAMIITDSLRSQGYNFVLGLTGIIFWPLGWGLGHVGTVAIASWFSNMLGAILGYQANGYTLTDGKIFDWVLNGPVVNLPAITPQSQACILLVVFAGALIVVIWVLLVTLCSPFIISRALRSGSGMFSDLAGGSAKSALALSGAALQVAAAAMGAAAMGRAANGTGGNNTPPTGGDDQSPPPPGGPGGGVPIGANAAAALANLAQRATSQPTPGTGGMYAVSPSGRAAFIPMTRNQMQSLLAGNGIANGGQLANGGSGSGNDGGGANGGGSGSGAGIGSQSRPKMSAATQAAYRFTMAAAGLSALGGALTAASQSDGSPGSLASVPTGAASSGVDRAERTRHMQDIILQQQKKT
jgi:hypothetical protein